MDKEEASKMNRLEAECDEYASELVELKSELERCNDHVATIGIEAEQRGYERGKKEGWDKAQKQKREVVLETAKVNHETGIRVGERRVWEIMSKGYAASVLSPFCCKCPFFDVMKSCSGTFSTCPALKDGGEG